MWRVIILFQILLTGHGLTAQGQSGKQKQLSINDSVKIKNTIEGFYSWYGDIIKRNRLDKEFNPVFIKDKDGMTTLDFTKYREGLRKHNFSEDFIKRRMSDYNHCLVNLKKIKYDSLIKFELDEYEQIQCDFSNMYEWSGGMDAVDGAELVALKEIDTHTVASTVRFYNKTNDGVKQYRDSAYIFMLKKFKTGWMIDDLK